MLTYSFTDIGSDSLYEHLYKCIKNDIIQGVLKPGEKLPSKRSFAKNLGISVITIENSYEQLVAEGYIYSIPKKGFFIADLQNTTMKKPIVLSAENMQMTSGESKYLADFASNRAIGALFPFSIWAKLLRECLHDFQEALLISSPSGGSIYLRESIAKHLQEFHGMTVNPEQIIIGTGTEQLYGQIVQLLGHDKIYGVEDPGYPKVAQVYEVNAAKVKYVKFEDDGISIVDLEQQKVQVAHTSPSHQFPTGLVTPISKRYELLGWASKDKERYIIEDDYDSEFRMVGQPIPTLRSIDTMEKVIYMNTFSKSIATTMRISYMVLPKHLLNLYYKKLSFYTCPVTTLIQYSLARFIEEGYFEKHINRMRTYYGKQRELLVKLIQKSRMAKYASIYEADAGLHFILRFDIRCSDEEFKQRMERRGIRICALSEYFKREENKTENYFVINYSSFTEEQIREAVKQLTQEVLLVKR
ncbi:MocR-like pyridoxine biosynthesis transcription factor PdxR [Anaerosporobacter faecicola]|uniref:MocR-like pyridoxine biosynthesis transcription factor PdxR n=1 Tax=Anaerosporobacter faecicola TaxID=2718714 RepID=UPI00143BB0B7|nr:PLP-dependent aminotransferase family protein [Anaerosporobacter faecicola]